MSVYYHHTGTRLLNELTRAIRSYDWTSSEVSKESRDIFTKELPKLIKTFILDSNNYKVYGSVGKGNKAEIPWVAILDPGITTSTLRGYYVVLLFSNHGQGVYMCLSVGWDQFENLYGRAEGLRKIRELCEFYGKKSKLPLFKPGPIKLGTKTTRGKGYENGVIISRKISFISMNDEVIQNELNVLLRKYQSLKQRVGSSILNIDPADYELDKRVEEFQRVIVKKTLKPIDEATIKALIERASSGSPEIREKLYKQIVRVRPFAEFVKQKNNYICEICGRKPFMQKNGKPYAEADHITPLGRSSCGKDSPENMRCLCPLCHAVITHGSEEEIIKLIPVNRQL
jgi:5-methylcytosine-specific restriction protein A